MQIELNFRIAVEDVSAFRRHPLLKHYTSSRARSYQRTSIYFDTPDFQLKHHHVALQVARVGKGWQQTLTAIRSEGAYPHSHREWGSDVAGPNLDLSAIAQLLAHDPEFKPDRFDTSLISSLTPIFMLASRRSIWHLDFGQGQEAELTMDNGEVHSGTARTPIGYLTLAHRCGATDVFFEFASALVRDFNLRLAYLNQADVGYGLHDCYLFNAVTAKRVVLAPDINIEEGIRTIIRNCFSQISGNAAGVSIGRNAECIHQMRVGLRRLRSAIEIFESVIPYPERIQTDLDWLSAELGAARDWEVLGESTLPSIAERAFDISDLGVLRKKVQLEVARRHRKTSAALNSTRSTTLWLMLKQWLYQLGVAPEANTSMQATETMRRVSLRDFAEDNLRRCHKKILNRCKAIEISAPASYHRTRIACKRMRYVTEFFISYCPKKSVDTFLVCISELQDILGASNDNTVASQLLSNLAEKYPDLSEVCAYVKGYLAAQDEYRLVGVGKQIRRFSSLKKLHMRDGKH